LLIASRAARVETRVINALGDAIKHRLPVVSVVRDGAGRRLLSLFQLPPPVAELDRNRSAPTQVGRELTRFGFPYRASTPGGDDDSKPYVFLSYSSGDSDIVSPLRAALKRWDVRYFDYERDERDPGRFRAEIDRELKGATAVLCVLSENWFASKYCVPEFELAEEVGVQTILLAVAPFRPRYTITGRQCINFQTSFPEGERKLKAVLRMYKLV
jgi:hypothetical protein